jgi:titin
LVFALFAVSAAAAKPFPAPTNLFATTVLGAQIDINWDDNSKDEDGFIVERSSNGVDFIEITEVDENITSYSDINLDPATTYWYKVRAYRIKKGVYTYSNYTNIDSDTTLGVVPDGPTSLSATYFSASSSVVIVLNWCDNSDNENGFEIERSTNGVDFWCLDWVSSNFNYYYDWTVQASTTHWYKVRAYNDYGYSDYSNTEFIFTN